MAHKQQVIDNLREKCRRNEAERRKILFEFCKKERTIRQLKAVVFSCEDSIWDLKKRILQFEKVFESMVARQIRIAHKMIKLGNELLLYLRDVQRTCFNTETVSTFPASETSVSNGISSNFESTYGELHRLAEIPSSSSCGMRTLHYINRSFGVSPSRSNALWPSSGYSLFFSAPFPRKVDAQTQTDSRRGRASSSAPNRLISSVSKTPSKHCRSSSPTEQITKNPKRSRASESPVVAPKRRKCRQSARSSKESDVQALKSPKGKKSLKRKTKSEGIKAAGKGRKNKTNSAINFSSMNRKSVSNTFKLSNIKSIMKNSFMNPKIVLKDVLLEEDNLYVRKFKRQLNKINNFKMNDNRSEAENFHDGSREENFHDRSEENFQDRSEEENFQDRSEEENFQDRSEEENFHDRSEELNFYDRSDEKNINDRSEDEEICDGSNENEEKLDDSSEIENSGASSNGEETFDGISETINVSENFEVEKRNESSDHNEMLNSISEADEVSGTSYAKENLSDTVEAKKSLGGPSDANGYLDDSEVEEDVDCTSEPEEKRDYSSEPEEQMNGTSESGTKMIDSSAVEEEMSGTSSSAVEEEMSGTSEPEENSDDTSEVDDQFLSHLNQSASYSMGILLQSIEEVFPSSPVSLPVQENLKTNSIVQLDSLHTGYDAECTREARAESLEPADEDCKELFRSESPVPFRCKRGPQTPPYPPPRDLLSPSPPPRRGPKTPPGFPPSDSEDSDDNEDACPYGREEYSNTIQWIRSPSPTP